MVPKDEMYILGTKENLPQKILCPKKLDQKEIFCPKKNWVQENYEKWKLGLKIHLVGKKSGPRKFVGYKQVLGRKSVKSKMFFGSTKIGV